MGNLQTMRRMVMAAAVTGLVATDVVMAGPRRQYNRYRARKADTSETLRAYADSIPALIERAAAAARADSGRTDGRYYRLFVPLTFYHSPAAVALGRTWGNGGKAWDNDGKAWDDDGGNDAVADAVDSVLLGVYLRRPDLVLNSEDRLSKTGTLRADIDAPVRQEMELADKTEPMPDELPTGLPVRVVVKKPDFWTFSGDNSLQFMQNYISENWHKGGEPNYSMVAGVTLNANYNNKQRLKWENKLELKIGFQTSRSDTVHKFKTTEDLIRYTGKVGLQAAKRWYYTLQLLAYTQFARGLKSNDETVYSDFMSPFNLNVGLGMDYAVETANKRLTGNVNLSVLSFNFRYVDRKSLAARYGVAGDHHTLEDFGSQLTTTLTWKISDMVKWQTRLYAFTTYERALIEWENTVTLNVSRCISASLFFYPRFDDSTRRDDDWSYWQFKEYSSLGFCYSF